MFLERILEVFRYFIYPSILNEIVSVLNSLATGLNTLPPALPLGGAQIGGPIVALVSKLKVKLNTSTMLSNKVRTT